MRWDIFCRVIDNYGDAGVCWRLARQLASEHRLDVTLWIDRLATLARLEPAIDSHTIQQRHRGVTLRALDAGDTGVSDMGSSGPAASGPAESGVVAFDPAPVVVEGFGCGLPQPYLDAMETRPRPPVWFNLEYLSAEPWVDDVHGLASQHPQRRLVRYFWFPGFTSKSGGLIREAGLLDARDVSREGTGTADSDRSDDSVTASELVIVLFCYPNRALPAMFELWSQGNSRVRCIIPEGVATDAVSTWLGSVLPPVPRGVTRGKLTLDLRPFCSQDAFDRLLWASDVNFVRGEDSFVRAQWAAKPFVWQPYPQEAGAQLAKLDTFLDRYAPDVVDAAQSAQRRLAVAFNVEDGRGAVSAWPAFQAVLPVLAAHARRWAAAQAARRDLASGLVAFAREHL